MACSKIRASTEVGISTVHDAFGVVLPKSRRAVLPSCSCTSKLNRIALVSGLKLITFPQCHADLAALRRYRPSFSSACDGSLDGLPDASCTGDRVTPSVVRDVAAQRKGTGSVINGETREATLAQGKPVTVDGRTRSNFADRPLGAAVTVILVTFASFVLPVVAWVIGVVCLVRSTRWTRVDKVVGILGWPLAWVGILALRGFSGAQLSPRTARCTDLGFCVPNPPVPAPGSVFTIILFLAAIQCVVFAYLTIRYKRGR